MCGLVGMVGQGIIKDDLDNLRDLGIISQLRGRDGAGLYRINSANSQFTNELLLKTGSDWSNLLFDVETTPRSQASANLFSLIYANVFIGHVRAATRGKVCYENSHPFRFPSLVGVHNGTLKDKKYQSASQTDSELMFEDMENRGVTTVLRELEDESAFAIVMYDKHSKRVVMARNERRQLWVACHNRRNVMYWASERAFLELILDRSNEDYTIYWVRPNFVFEINPQTIDCKNHKCLVPVDVISQAKEDERLRKVKELEEKKLQEEQASLSSNTPIFQPSPDAQNLGEGSIVILDTVRHPIKNPEWHIHCDCGKQALNLTDSLGLRNGTRIWSEYSIETDTFKCAESCQTKH